MSMQRRVQTVEKKSGGNHQDAAARHLGCGQALAQASHRL